MPIHVKLQVTSQQFIYPNDSVLSVSITSSCSETSFMSIEVTTEQHRSLCCVRDVTLRTDSAPMIWEAFLTDEQEIYVESTDLAREASNTCNFRVSTDCIDLEQIDVAVTHAAAGNITFEIVKNTEPPLKISTT